MLGERKFYIHNPDLMDSLNYRYQDKAATNKRVGIERYATGKEGRFKGYKKEDLINEFNVILEIDNSSKEAVKARVSEPMKQLLAAYNISAIFAGESDIHHHITLQPIKLAVESDEERDQIQKHLQNDRFLHTVGSILIGVPIVLDDFVVSGGKGGLYISSHAFTEENIPIYKARLIIKRVVTGEKNFSGLVYGSSKDTIINRKLSPVQLDDITHMAIGRVISHTMDQTTAKEFVERAYSEIGESLKNDPVEVLVNNVYIGNTYTYFSEHAPHLIHED